MVHSPKKCQLCPKLAPYEWKLKTPSQKNGLTTSTKLSDTGRHKNLTLNDWLMVFAYIDEHSDLPGLCHPAFQDTERGGKKYLGNHYIEKDWIDALKAVMDVEGDNIKASEAIKKLASAACQKTGLVVKILPLPKAPQLDTLEHELMKSIEELTTQRQIIGAPLTVDKILNPQEEKNVGEVTPYEDDNAIVAEIQCQQAIRSGELVEVESDDEDEDDSPKVCAIELIPLCKKLEAV
ncbi:hypothetical protein BDR07DRAFT_1497689 [Suillus spraguei]|nr:hypothetical protein BDR07DRAFT_1497689 [Suillus spraguei]